MSNYQTEKQHTGGIKFTGLVAIGSILLVMLIGGALSNWFRDNERAVNYWFTVSIIVATLAAVAAQDFWQKMCDATNEIERSKENPPND